MRRVVDCAGAPGAQGNKIIGRAGRAFLDRSGISAEVFNISRVRARIQYAMDGLSAPATCSCQSVCCATGSVSIVTLDADQAFEACSASAVLQAWDAVEHVIQERIGSRVVLVERGKKEVTSSQVISSLGGGRSAWMWSGKRFVPSPGVAGLCGRIGV